MNRSKLMTVIASFLMLTGCGSYSGDKSSVTVQSENSSFMKQSDSSVSSVTSDRQNVTTAEQHEENEVDSMKFVIGDKQFPVTLESNNTVTAFTKMLPLSLDMSELNGNEKYYYLNTPLPSAPENVGHINEGDIMLYGDNCIVIFYESFDTSYSYTKIGHFDDTSGLADTLGTGDVTVSLE